MTGHNSFDNDPWILKLVEFTKKVLAQDRVRLIGVCFGHQIIGRALDVKVDRSDKGWEISVTDVKLTEQGRRLFGIDELVSTKRTRSLYMSGLIVRAGDTPNAPRHRVRISGRHRSSWTFIALRGARHVREETLDHGTR